MSSERFHITNLNDIMSVFISHRNADNSLARSVYDKLTKKGVICYIDDLDVQAKTTDDITALLLQRLAQSTHLLAVVTSNTAGSWWVPFEIGVATESAKRIATFSYARTALPEYLWKWPALASDSDIDKFASSYFYDLTMMDKHVTASRGSQRADADAFHRSLKRSLGQ